MTSKLICASPKKIQDSFRGILLLRLCIQIRNCLNNFCEQFRVEEKNWKFFFAGFQGRKPDLFSARVLASPEGKWLNFCERRTFSSSSYDDD